MVRPGPGEGVTKLTDLPYSIGPYRIVSRLGAGAMGEVYRARDPRLDREVAIKVLPEALASEDDRIARFRREARVAASLNHPNIASVYGFEEVASTHFLVMELVEGQTLAERLRGGAIPIDEALVVVEQIAEGLEAAHESGIVHRDLKPSNVKLTPEGKAKILDFGLAKALETESPPVDLERSPTLTAHLTEAGMVFGTVPYMSPEQARGRPVDKRSDIWALGCLLYECLSGRRAFDGETATDVLARILERDPDWDALPARTPPRVRELLERCLEKDLKHRARDAGDVRIELERARAAREWSSEGSWRSGSSHRRRWARVLPWAVAGIAIATIVTLLTRSRLTAGTATPPVRKTSVTVDVTDPETLRYASADIPSVAVSSDGTTIAYLGRAPKSAWYGYAIYVRHADDIHAIRVAEPKEQGYELFDPFFSPDGQWLGYSGRGLYKVSLSGGDPVLLSENLSAGGTKGATWTARGIVFSPTAKAGLVLVKADGGRLETLTIPDAAKGEVSHRWPSALPDGRHILFTIKKEGLTSFDQGEIALLDLEKGSWKTLLRGGSFARYLPSGQIVFARNGAILAAPFDLRKEEVTGPTVTILSDVMTEPGTGAAQFAIAEDARAVLFVPGGPNIKRTELVWIDRRGNITPVGSPLESYYQPHLSPDGTRVASTVYGATDAVVVYDLAGRSSVRIPSEGNCALIGWHPDGRQLLIGSDLESGAMQTLFLANADGSGKPRRLDLGVQAVDARILSRLLDGVALIHRGPSDLLLTRLDGPQTTQPISGAGEVDPAHPAVSPDGRWLAYDYDIAGHKEVYVRRFPSGNGLWQISRDGGTAPIWSPRGDEIVYQKGFAFERSLVSVHLTATAGGIAVGMPQELFKIPPQMDFGEFHPDGTRLIGVRPVPAQYKGDRVMAILDWFDQVAAKTSPQ